MQTILLASDLSDRSDAALGRAVELAVATGARLTLHHVVDSAMPAPIAGQVRTEAARSMEETLERCLDGRSLDCAVSAEVGDVSEGIAAAVEATGAELLIVGVHRRRAFLDQYRETTMERLIRASEVPVLMVQRAVTGPYAHMLGAVGLSRNCAAAIRLGLRIAPAAKVTLFHAHEVSFARESALDYADWKAASGLPAGMPDPILVEGPAEDVVQDLMAEDTFDLMTLGAHTRPGMGRRLLGGLAASLIRKPPCDLLVAK